jgi:hypothetical protein
VTTVSCKDVVVNKEGQDLKMHPTTDFKEIGCEDVNWTELIRAGSIDEFL